MNEKVVELNKSRRNIKYICDRCKKPVGKKNLRAKRVQFREMGEHGKVLQTRVTEWICVPCMLEDPDYQRPSRAGSPGMRDTRMAQS